MKNLKSSGVHRIDGKNLSSVSSKRIHEKHLEVFGIDAKKPKKEKVDLSLTVGFVYFIGNTEFNFCKIGFSRSPESRIMDLQTGCPFALKVIHVIEGSLQTEKELHRKFRMLKTYGEWFKIEGILKDYLSPYLDGLGRFGMVDLKD